MKILIVGIGFSTGGTAVVVKNICPILMKKHNVTILTNDSGSIDIKCNRLIQLKSKPYPISQYGYMPDLRKMVKNHQLDDYDIIHVFDYPQFGADYLTLKKNKIKPPIVLNTHGSIHQFNEFPLNVFKKIHNIIMLNFKKRISSFIALTEAEKKHLIENGIEKEKIRIISLGVNPSVVNHDESDEKTILYLGRLAKTKNVEILIESFHKCKDKTVKLILAGPDYGMRKKLEKLVTKLNLENKVIFKGSVTEIEKNRLFSKCTIFIHPSLEDIFSLALVEAAASGIPCIAFDVEGNSEILEDDITGKLVEKSKLLTQSIEELLENKSLRLKISENAKKEIPIKFDWNKTVEQLENIYTEIINKNKKL